MRTLSTEEIEEVKGILKDRHPLYYKSHSAYDIFPVLKCLPWYKNNEREVSDTLLRMSYHQFIIINLGNPTSSNRT
jgi:hypothetical protein